MSSSPHHWRDRAIAGSEVISDAWEITKAYSARLAEWVLFGCMICNIIEILPDIHLPSAVSSAVLGVQAVTLDIAGFGLASMADHARRNGNTSAARKASITGYCLIAIMLITLLTVSIGVLWPASKDIVTLAEKVLILVRVLMTVIYGHVIHGLRSDSQASSLARGSDSQASQSITQKHQQASFNDASQSVSKQAANTSKHATKASDDNEARIRDYRVKHPDATQNEIASSLGISRSTVQRYHNTTKQPLRMVK